MQATSTQTRTDPGKAVTAVLAASVFAAGVALGAIVGTTIAPGAEPAAVGVQALDPGSASFRQHRAGEINAGAAGQALDADATWFRDYRDGEINAGAAGQALDPDTNSLREHRDGEINAGADPDGGVVSTERRDKIGGQ